MSGEVSSLLSVRVVPNASRSEVIGWMDDGCLKLKVQAPPEGGRANAEVCLLLARALGLGKNGVSVESGKKSRMKTIRIVGMDTDSVRSGLAFRA